MTSPLATPQAVAPTFSQAIPECPVVCELSENADRWNPASPTTVVSQFSPTYADFVINTANVGLDNTKVLLVIECSSVDSTVSSSDGSADRSDAIGVKINLYDHCRRVDIIEPTF